MEIEEDVFKKYKIDRNKLLDYGFISNNGKLYFEKILSKKDFKAILEFDETIKGRIFDLSFGDEYTNYRLENSDGFSSEIRQEYIDLLTDIRDKCTEKELFRFSQTQSISKYIKDKYGDLPEFLWAKLPEYAIFRNKKSNKWYGVVGCLPRKKINHDVESDEIVEILNVKVKKEETENLLKKEGIYEAFHMNKKSWVTIILDGTLTLSEIETLIDNSYNNV